MFKKNITNLMKKYDGEFFKGVFIFNKIAT